MTTKTTTDPPTFGPSKVRIGGDIVATTALLVLGVVFAFDSTYVVFELDRVQMRPHHLIVAIAVGGSIISLLGAPPHRFSALERTSIFGLTFAAGALATAAFFSPRGAIVHQRTFDLLIVFGVAFAVVVVVRTEEIAKIVGATMAAGVVLALGVALLAYVDASDIGLGDRYRGRVTLLGDERRLTRPFSHANIAAMFMAPAAVAMAGWACLGRGRQGAGAAVVAGLLALSVSLTASRAGVAAVLVGALGLLIVFGIRQSIVVAGALTIGLLAAIPMSPAIRDRLTGSDRFAATVTVPDNFELSGPTTVSAHVRNDSSDLWPAAGSGAVRLTARWRNPDQDKQWLTQTWPLPEALGPGESADVVVQVLVDVPDGTYLVVWDLLLDREAFFLESRGEQSVMLVEVTGSTADLAAGPVVRARVTPGRRSIWGWSLALFAKRPWFGHGPGAMRFVVNEVAATERAVSPSHAHNIALEPLSSWGMVGSVPFLALLGFLVVDIPRRVRRVDAVTVAVGFGLVGVLVHGLLEWPLMFPPLGIGFGMLAGMWMVGRERLVTP